jgi:hypothetical protein
MIVRTIDQSRSSATPIVPHVKTTAPANRAGARKRRPITSPAIAATTLAHTNSNNHLASQRHEARRS